MEEVHSNRIRSSFSKGLLIFFLLMWVLTLTFFILTFFLIDDLAFKIISFIFCGGFNLLAAYLLIDTLTNYVVVEDDKIIKHSFLYRKVEKISSITKVIHDQNFFTVYVHKKKFVSLNDRDPQTPKMLFQFEKCGIDIGKIETKR